MRITKQARGTTGRDEALEARAAERRGRKLGLHRRPGGRERVAPEGGDGVQELLDLRAVERHAERHLAAQVRVGAEHAVAGVDVDLGNVVVRERLDDGRAEVALHERAVPGLLRRLSRRRLGARHGLRTETGVAEARRPETRRTGSLARVGYRVGWGSKHREWPGEALTLRASPG